MTPVCPNGTPDWRKESGGFFATDSLGRYGIASTSAGATDLT